MLESLLDLLVPPRCLSCGRPGRELCGACRRDVPFLDTACCERCGLPSPCGARCPADGLAFAAAWAPVAHAGPARDLVAALKFRSARRAATIMAAQITAGAPSGLLAGVLVPAPAHPSRAARRGYDQAAVLARAVGRRTGLDVVSVLARRGRVTRQVGSSRETRLAAGRLRVQASAPFSGRAVLIDDVHTTGATLDACARALLAAGAREVVAVTYARSL